MPDDNAADPSEQQPPLRRITESLARHGDDALHGAATIEEAARGWLAAGFADAEEIDDWLGARCFDPGHAQTLESAGITPGQAALRTREGRAGYEETIACKLAAGDLTLAEARRIITDDFWNS